MAKVTIFTNLFEGINELERENLDCAVIKQTANSRTRYLMLFSQKAIRNMRFGLESTIQYAKDTMSDCVVDVSNGSLDIPPHFVVIPKPNIRQEDLLKRMEYFVSVFSDEAPAYL